jgi:surfeit locus 1 family protein
MPKKLSERFHSPTPIAWFFFLLCFGVTMALGTWQMQRMQWKEGLISQIAAAQKNTPKGSLPTDEASLKAMQFLPVRVKGTWRGDVEFHLAPRYLNDQFGYALITPLTLADGRTVLVNRGWIPAAKKDAKTRPETLVRGKTTVEGLVRVGAERSYFTPVSQPDKNIWFGRDIADMAAAAKLENVVPVMIDATASVLPAKPELEMKKGKKSTTPPNAKHSEAAKLPIPSDGTIRVRNDHMGYILTWYGIAAGIFVIFFSYHLRRPAKKRRR